MANPLSTCADWCNKPGPDFTGHTLARDSFYITLFGTTNISRLFENIKALV